MSRYIDAKNLTLIKNLATLISESEVIDIVRCKECKQNYNKVLNHGKMQPRCDFTDRALTENDFCSRGEREDE